MLPQKNRLKKRRDFERVFKEGRGYKGSFLFLKAAKSGRPESRFAFAAGRKVSGKAVVRNKVKRRMREAVKVFLPGVKPGADAVLAALPGAGARTFAEIKKEAEELFKKANLLRSECLK